MKRSLTITKTREYTWTVDRNMFADHVNRTCWWVVDAGTNEVVAGGFDRGSNVRCGSVEIKRRKDAQAFVAGYVAGVENGFSAMADARDYALSQTTSSHVSRNIRRTPDEEIADWFRAGVDHAVQGSRCQTAAV